MADVSVSLGARDARHLIHPVTEPREMLEKGPRIVVEGDGWWVTDDRGHRIIDGFAGLWCVAVGHGRPEIIDAVATQLRELDYFTTFHGQSHPRAIELAEKVASMFDPAHGLNHVMFSSGGSEANETNFKLIRLYWALQGQDRRTTIVASPASAAGAWHGPVTAASTRASVRGQICSRTGRSPSRQTASSAGGRSSAALTSAGAAVALRPDSSAHSRFSAAIWLDAWAKPPAAALCRCASSVSFAPQPRPSRMSRARPSTTATALPPEARTRAMPPRGKVSIAGKAGSTTRSAKNGPGQRPGPSYPCKETGGSAGKTAAAATTAAAAKNRSATAATAAAATTAMAATAAAPGEAGIAATMCVAIVEEAAGLALPRGEQHRHRGGRAGRVDAEATQRFAPLHAARLFGRLLRPRTVFCFARHQDDLHPYIAFEGVSGM